MQTGSNQTPPAGASDSLPAGNNPPAPSDSPPAGNQIPPGDGNQEEDLEKLKSSLAASRKDADEKAKEARAAKQRADAAEAELQKHKDAEKSDLERAQDALKQAEARAEAAEKAARAASLRFAVIEAARAENFANPEDPYHFLDMEQVEFDAKGHPIGIPEMVKTLAAERKYLIASKQSATPPPPSDTPDRNGAGATPEEMSQRREEMNIHTHRTF